MSISSSSSAAFFLLAVLLLERFSGFFLGCFLNSFSWFLFLISSALKTSSPECEIFS